MNEARVKRASGVGSVHPRDAGQSLAEVLVAVMLTGVLGVASMITLRTSIMASVTDRDHANAFAWLQSASDVLYGAERADCGTQAVAAPEAVAAAYEAIAQSTPNPRNWPAANITVERPVKFWDGKSTYQNTCYDDSGINLQLIRLQVAAPDGKIIETVEIVKG